MHFWAKPRNWLCFLPLELIKIYSPRQSWSLTLKTKSCSIFIFCNSYSMDFLNIFLFVFSEHFRICISLSFTGLWYTNDYPLLGIIESWNLVWSIAKPNPTILPSSQPNNNPLCGWVVVVGGGDLEIQTNPNNRLLGHF